ncbi:unnamed protein product [Effrenium voratum]|nr:unnamed protein product [Effrenium voratum]
MATSGGACLALDGRVLPGCAARGGGVLARPRDCLPDGGCEAHGPGRLGLGLSGRRTFRICGRPRGLRPLSERISAAD